MVKNRKNCTWIAFAVYGLVMLWLLFGQRWGQNAGGRNLKLFDTVQRYIWVLKYSRDSAQIRHAVINLAGNVVMFVPLGFFVPMLWKKMHIFGWHFLTMVATIVAVELLQLLTRLGTCDIDDLVLNVIGTTMGFGLFKLYKHICCRGGS